MPCRVSLSKHPSVIQGHKLAFGGVESICGCFFSISFLLSSFFPPLCEIFVLYWHGEHPSHQCLHASTVPGGARGGEGGAHSSPTIAKSGIQWKSPEEWDLTVCLGGVYQVVRHGWLKDAHRIHQRCCCFAERIKDYDASRVAVTVYCIIFVNLFFFSVKDGYNNLFAGNCKRHDRTYNTYRDGRWVSSLNNTLKLHSAIFMLFF